LHWFFIQISITDNMIRRVTIKIASGSEASGKAIAAAVFLG
jgi:hypothetical protein